MHENGVSGMPKNLRFFVHLEKEDLKNIYYSVDFPNNKLTVLKIKEDALIFVEKYKNK